MTVEPLGDQLGRELLLDPPPPLVPPPPLRGV
jgi:hypothetical protein